MAKTTVFFAVLLIGLGLFGYLGTESLHPTALIPTWIGLVLGFFGFLAMSRSEDRRKLFMHINVTIGLLGFLGASGMVGLSCLTILRYRQEALAAGVNPMDVFDDSNFTIALGSKVTLAVLLLIYVILCVRSFRAARRSGRV
jgi:hypothetical protein